MDNLIKFLDKIANLANNSITPMEIENNVWKNPNQKQEYEINQLHQQFLKAQDWGDSFNLENNRNNSLSLNRQKRGVNVIKNKSEIKNTIQKLIRKFNKAENKLSQAQEDTNKYQEELNKLGTISETQKQKWIEYAEKEEKYFKKYQAANDKLKAYVKEISLEVQNNKIRQEIDDLNLTVQLNKLEEEHFLKVKEYCDLKEARKNYQEKLKKMGKLAERAHEERVNSARNEEIMENIHQMAKQEAASKSPQQRLETSEVVDNQQTSPTNTVHNSQSSTSSDGMNEYLENHKREKEITKSQQPNQNAGDLSPTNSDNTNQPAESSVNCCMNNREKRSLDLPNCIPCPSKKTTQEIKQENPILVEENKNLIEPEELSEGEGEIGKVVVGAEVITELASAGNKTNATATAEKLGDIGGAIVGWEAGAEAGGAIGTAIEPVGGTVLGAAIGGSIGSIAGSEVGKKIGEKIVDWDEEIKKNANHTKTDQDYSTIMSNSLMLGR